LRSGGGSALSNGEGLYHPDIRFDRIYGLLQVKVEPLLVAVGKEDEKERGDNSGGHRKDGFVDE
jgi:hypothetical protein